MQIKDCLLIRLLWYGQQIRNDIITFPFHIIFFDNIALSLKPASHHRLRLIGRVSEAREELGLLYHIPTNSSRRFGELFVDRKYRFALKRCSKLTRDRKSTRLNSSH